MASEARSARLRALQSIADVALAHLGLDELLRELLDRVRSVLGTDSATILLVTPDRRHLTEHATRGIDRTLPPGSPIPIGRGVVGRIAAGRQPLAIGDLDAEERLSPTLLAGGLRSVLGTPLLVEGELIGVLHVGSRRSRRFTTDDEQLLQLVADRVALAVDRARLHEAEHEARTTAEAAQRRLSFLATASVELAASLEYGSTMERVARLAVPELADWCVVDTVDENGAIHLTAVAHVDPAQERLVRELRERYPIDPERPYGLPRVLRTGEPELYPLIEPAWRRSAARDHRHLELMDALDAGSAMCVPLRARGHTLGAMTFVRTGGTARYRSEELALAEELARRCALAIDNARLYRAAQEAVAMRDAVLATVSHDLRNPLSSLAGTAQLLRIQMERANAADPALVAARMREMEAMTARMTGMIGELLDATRLQAGEELELFRRPTDLRTVVERVVAEQRRATERHEIVVQAPNEPLTGEWDRERLARVFDNLLSNAVKYSPGGGAIEIRIERERADDRDWASARVSDRGIGIPPGEIDAVFERFRRARNVTGRIAGVGLGLAGARRIVEQHGGTIHVESREGVGSTFTVRLPLH